MPVTVISHFLNVSENNKDFYNNKCKNHNISTNNLLDNIELNI